MPAAHIIMVALSGSAHGTPLACRRPRSLSTHRATIMITMGPSAPGLCELPAMVLRVFYHEPRTVPELHCTLWVESQTRETRARDTRNTDESDRGAGRTVELSTLSLCKSARTSVRSGLCRTCSGTAGPRMARGCGHLPLRAPLLTAAGTPRVGGCLSGLGLPPCKEVD